MKGKLIKIIIASIALALTTSLTACSSAEQSLAANCESKVADELVSPSTAKFSGLQLTHLDKSTFAIQGNVDAQNKLGATLRSVFVCEGTSDKNVRVVYLSSN